MYKLKFSAPFVFVMVAFLGLTSCYTTKNSVYFTDLPDSSLVKKIKLASFKEPVILPDDILAISVQTVDPTVTATLNQIPTGNIVYSSGSPIISGYLVNKNGEVTIPIIGVVKVGGLTTTQAAAIIKEAAVSSYKIPTVQVRFANFRINVLGEVARPGTFIMPNERVSVIDAISLAGDLTVYSKRENILIVRDEDGQKVYGRLNLNSSDVFNSPFFYLKQNDLIYVEPNKTKINGSNDTQTFRLASFAVSLVTLLSVLIIRFK